MLGNRVIRENPIALHNVTAGETATIFRCILIIILIKEIITMAFYVYSTATNSGTYVEYEKNMASDIAIPKKWPDGKPMRVTIKGGHGVANKHMFTPRGVVTKVDDREMEWLLTNPAFKRHMDKGFITYDKKNIAPEKKARDMEQKDGSAPLTPGDYEETENSHPGHRIYKAKNDPLASMGM